MKQHPLLAEKTAGLLFPLFALRTRNDWGIGDIGAISPWTDWMHEAGLGILQFLPLNEMPPGEHCPYKAMSAFALDPIYISVPAVKDASGCKEYDAFMLSREVTRSIISLRRMQTVDYDTVRDLKFRSLWIVFQNFLRNEWQAKTARARELEAFRQANAGWLDDYAAFRLLKDMHGWRSWTEWEHGLRSHDQEALKRFRAAHQTQLLYFEYLQWVAHSQWRAAKKKANEKGIRLFGDLPFMVNQESADVWGRQNEFDINSEVGAPPDQFSKDGQKWGLPAYNWWEVEKSGFAWWRSKAAFARELYDLFRLDHVVGFFRTWIVPRDKNRKADFDLKEEHQQKERGRRFLKAVSESGSPMLPVAEDLGVIPPFVREVMAELSIPGYKVMRWEKDDGAFREPKLYPKVSLATTSTHDTESVKEWWKALPAGEREAAWLMISGETGKHPGFTAAVHEAITRRLLESNSALAILPIQDIMGAGERTNTPGTVGEHNWTYRFPVPVEKLRSDAEVKEKTAVFIRLMKSSGRFPSR